MFVFARRLCTKTKNSVWVMSWYWIAFTCLGHETSKKLQTNEKIKTLVIKPKQELQRLKVSFHLSSILMRDHLSPVKAKITIFKNWKYIRELSIIQAREASKRQNSITQSMWTKSWLSKNFPLAPRERFRTRWFNNRGLYTFVEICLYFSQFNITLSVLRSN